MNEAETRAMQLEPKHIAALDMAERFMFHSDFCPYLELKALLPDASPEARHRFRILFTSFYGFNMAGITEEFKDKFFHILHDGNVLLKEQPDFIGILDQLSRIKRKKGDFALPFSFVSKLVAMHSAASPIYDRHVLAFFEERAPASSVAKATRIKWYQGFLDYVARSYGTWANDSRVAEILDRLKRRDRQLASCHTVRLMDFLVWKVGNQRLLAK
jgi:hypothetical protein